MKKYEAFISYRHTEPDKTIAEKLHKMLKPLESLQLLKNR